MKTSLINGYLLGYKPVINISGNNRKINLDEEYDSSKNKADEYVL